MEMGARERWLTVGETPLRGWRNRRRLSEEASRACMRRLAASHAH